MSDRPTPPNPTGRILVGAISVGLLFAALCGIGVASSGGSEVDQPGATASVRTLFAPDLALLGFLLGAPVGGVTGALWGRGGVGGAIGGLLFTLLGGFGGMVVASLLGAQTNVTVSGNAVSVDHGAPMPVLVGGAVVGLAIAGLIAVRFGYRDRSASAERLVAADAGPAPGPART